MSEEKSKWPVFLTPDDISQMLQVSKVAVYKWARDGKIPSYHIEKCLRFNPLEVKEWIESKRGGEYHRDKV